MLKTNYGSVCLWPKDPIDLGSSAGIARQVTELEFLLHSFNRIALAAPFYLNDKSSPRYWTHDPIGQEPMARLKRFHRGLSCRTEYAVNADTVPACPEQTL
jgi:hypothetical protein